MIKTFLIILLLCTSCSKLKIKTSKNFPITTSQIEKDTKSIEVKVTKNFYLWGLIPNEHELLLDKELLKIGVKRLSALEITELSEGKDTWMKILSFGLFLPQTYLITGKTD